MKRPDKRAARAVVHLSAIIGACSVHDAGAGGRAIHVSDPRASRVLRRALLRVLSTSTPYLMRVSDEVATALSGSRESAPERGCCYLAVGLDRQGRSAFLLRRIPDEDDIDTRRLKEAQTLDDLQHFLRSEPPLLAEKPEDRGGSPMEG